jgi:hypothetical protein
MPNILEIQQFPLGDKLKDKKRPDRFSKTCQVWVARLKLFTRGGAGER